MHFLVTFWKVPAHCSTKCKILQKPENPNFYKMASAGPVSMVHSHQQNGNLLESWLQLFWHSLVSECRKIKKQWSFCKPPALQPLSRWVRQEPVRQEPVLFFFFSSLTPAHCARRLRTSQAVQDLVHQQYVSWGWCILLLNVFQWFCLPLWGWGTKIL